jgi:CHAT domain-containing protein/Tfp pilus assembly protein PilF
MVIALCCLPAVAQEAHWYQMSEQVVQLRDRGKIAEAIPLAQETVRVAEATFGPQDRHLGLSLNALGVLLTSQEKFADADAALRRALAIMVKASGAESRDVASVLDNLGDLYRNRGQYPDAEKFMQQALATHEKVLGPNDPNVATDAGNLALLYRDEGKYDDAEPLYRRAIAIDEKLQGPGNRDVATDLSNLGDLDLQKGKYPDAEAMFGKALSIDLKVLGTDHPQIATDLSDLGNAYVYEGKLSGAEPIFRRALEIDLRAQGPDSATVATILEGMGALYRGEGHYADSEVAYQRALANREKALGPDHPDVALILDNLGKLYSEQRRYGDAENTYRRALDIRVKRLGQIHPMVAVTLVNLGALYAEHGRWGDAETMYRNAMTIYVKTYGQEDVRVAALLNAAASLFIDEGKLPDAERVLPGAIAIYEKAKGRNDLALASTLNLLAQVYNHEGKFANSETVYKRAIDVDEKVSGPNSSNLAIELIGLADVYKNEDKFTDAEPVFRRAMSILETNLEPDDPALFQLQLDAGAFYYTADKPDFAAPYFDKALGNLMSRFKANIATMSERDRLIYFAGSQGAFPLYFSFALKFHDRDPALAGKVYNALLQQRGFIAQGAAAMRAHILASGDEQALALLDQLTSVKAQIATLDSSTQGNPTDRRKQIGQFAQQANQLEQEMAKRSSALADAKALSAVTWREVQQTLKPGEAAVEFTRFRFHNGKTFIGNELYVALVVTPESRNPAFVFLGDARDLESAPMASYRAVVAQTRGISAEPEPNAPAAAAKSGDTRAAYDAFWKPLEPALGNAKRVYVAPDGVLNQIPIGLLKDQGGKLLLEKYQLRSVNSTKDLLRPKPNASLRTAVLIGNPTFDLTDAAQRAALAALHPNDGQLSASDASSQTHVAAGQRSVDLSGGALNPLPGTQLEVNAIDKVLRNSAWHTSVFTGDRAQKAAIEQVRGPRLVHIATHGFFLSDQQITQKSGASAGQHVAIDDPMLRAGLFFAGANRTRSGTSPSAGLDDGVLTAYEASQLDLQGTELVVLSACETGLGQQLNSEGVFGLRPGLQEAGADAVLMSMWSVPDRETQELMALFYSKWLGGLDKPEALRQAQLQERDTVRQRYGNDLPFYWGAFVLVGR